MTTGAVETDLVIDGRRVRSDARRLGGGGELMAAAPADDEVAQILRANPDAMAATGAIDADLPVGGRRGRGPGAGRPGIP